MITHEKLKIYRKYYGDFDGWKLSGTEEEHRLIGESEWAQIRDLLTNIAQMKAGLLSPEYAKRITCSISDTSLDDSVVQELMRMAGRPETDW